MKIAVGCDPNGNDLKTSIIKELKNQNYEFFDFGSDDPIYANTIIQLAESIVSGEADKGIVICGTGIGASIAANKVPGAHCALVTCEYQAERAALSNNANIIALGAQLTTCFQATRFIQIWLDATVLFDPSGRSGPKIARIAEYENGKRLQAKQ